MAHPFYERLNQVLEEREFDAFVEQQCERFYAEAMGRRRWCRGGLLLIGYFEGIEGERGHAFSREAQQDDITLIVIDVL